MGFPGDSDSKPFACDAGDQSLIPGSGSSPKQEMAPGEFHGQRSLVGYSPYVGL